VGAALGPWLAHGDFQPTGPTPFRASVPRPAPGPRERLLRRAPRRRRPQAAILLYHRVAAQTEGAVDPARFAEHLAVLRDAWRPLALDDLAAAVRAGDVPDRAVAVTFDDGYADSAHRAGPALRAAQLPATVFVATGYLESGRPFAWSEMPRLLRAGAQRHDQLTLEVGGERRAWRLGASASLPAIEQHVHCWLQAQRPEVVAEALAQLREWAGAPPPDDEDPYERPMTVDELHAIEGAFAVGAHTRDHPRLAALSPEEQHAEIARSRDDLRGWLGRAPAGFAYPFGVPGHDFDASTVDAVRAAGFDYAVSNAAGPVTAASDRWALPRLGVPDLDGEHFGEWLEARLAR